jgi:CRP-like cAMP-binding protein
MSKNEIVFEEGDLEEDPLFYYLDRGCIEIFYESKNSNNSLTIVNQLTSGKYFGENTFITGKERTSGARVGEFSILYTISRN